MFQLTTIARPYAKAAFEFAYERKSLKHWKNMLELMVLIVKNKKFSQVSSSIFTTEVLFKEFLLISNGYLDDYGKNFVHIVIENKRLFILPTVLKEFIALCALLNHVVEIDVESKSILTEEQKIKIISAMEKHLSCTVKANFKINPSILGGIIIRIEDKVIDSSIRGRLTRLNSYLEC